MLVLLLLLLASVTRLWAFGYPDRIVFDELYFAKFVTHYFLHSYYFDIHPPLAKLLMAGVSHIAGADPNLTFGYTAINDAYPDSFYALLRAMVSLFGILLPVGIYALSRSLSFSSHISFLAGLCAVFDNALLVQSRFILTDAFLLSFGTFGLAGVLYGVRIVSDHATFTHIFSKPFFFIVGGSVLLGAAYSVKWTGLLFLGLALLFVAIRFLFPSLFKEHVSTQPLLKRFAQAGLYALLVLLVSCVIYVASMFVHIGELYKTGPGDAFMSASYKSTLLGSLEFGSSEFSNKQPGLLERFMELNARMYSANAGITAGHPYGSKWFTWPLMQRGVYYWYDKLGDGQEARIYLLGNPLIWWGGAIAVLTMLFYGLWRLIRSRHRNLIPIFFVLLGFCANLIAYIPITRVSFLYHYFPSFIFLCIALGWLLSMIKRWWIVGILVACIIATYIWMAPISYGSPLSPEQFKHRMILSTWE